MPRPPRLILASGSPRRTEILNRLGLEHTIIVPEIDEALDAEEAPVVAAERLARAKAEAGSGGDCLALGCDTLVVHRGGILGKPECRDEAIRMLSKLSGDEHAVFTGIALAGHRRIESTVETTRVWFRRLTGDEIVEYVDTGEPLDKAGAYGIQSYGAAIVDRIEGDYFNVMGLPTQKLLELFRRFGWRYAFGKLVPADSA